MKITYDENGNLYDELEERNKEIKEYLEPTLREFKKEKYFNKYARLGYRFAKQIYLALARYGRMSAEKFVNLTYDDINDYWIKYLELTAYYNQYFEIVDNKQMFCAFMGINTRQYSELEKSNDDDIKTLMSTINAGLIGLGFTAAESGNADSRSVSVRLRASGEAGHSIISATEDKIINAPDSVSPSEIEKQLEAMIGMRMALKSEKKD